ncbi:Bax inhibitor-1/YccA family protein [Demequina oxidasica]|uniref:Bax inhibitor-1/YccA family protein n=1 Tax=Demequina oxidasica TaxID=676199 RepID=UPI00078092E2|nr:Bax inhibitor-1/YccA family protein [Demequina oxidasica]
MASPVFNRGKEFQPASGAEAHNAALSGASMGGAVTATQTANLNAQFNAPDAGPADTGRMTYEGVITKTSGIGLLVLLFAIPGYMFPNTIGMIAGAIIGMVLGLVVAFQKRPKPALIALYAMAQGYFLGAITTWIQDAYDVPGAGLQALIATGVTFGVVLALYKSGKVRYTPKMQKFLMIGMISYLAFSLVNVMIMIFGPNDETNAWGLRTSVEIFGIPLGVLIGLFAVVLACVSLIGDFDFIENAVKNGMPAWVEWKAAFGLIVTLIWLYIEFLRIIAIFSGRR